MSQYLHSSYLELESLPLGDLMSLIKDVVAEQKKAGSDKPRKF